MNPDDIDCGPPVIFFPSHVLNIDYSGYTQDQSKSICLRIVKVSIVRNFFECCCRYENLLLLDKHRLRLHSK